MKLALRLAVVVLLSFLGMFASTNTPKTEACCGNFPTSADEVLTVFKVSCDYPVDVKFEEHGAGVEVHGRFGITIWSNTQDLTIDILAGQYGFTGGYAQPYGKTPFQHGGGDRFIVKKGTYVSYWVNGTTGYLGAGTTAWQGYPQQAYTATGY